MSWWSTWRIAAQPDVHDGTDGTDGTRTRHIASELVTVNFFHDEGGEMLPLGHFQIKGVREESKGRTWKETPSNV